MKVVKWGNWETGLVCGTLEATGDDLVSFCSSVWCDCLTFVDIVKKFAAFFIIGNPDRFCIWKVRAFSFVKPSNDEDDCCLSSSSSLSLTTAVGGLRKLLKLVPRFEFYADSVSQRSCIGSFLLKSLQNAAESEVVSPLPPPIRRDVYRFCCCWLLTKDCRSLFSKMSSELLPISATAECGSLIC